MARKRRPGKRRTRGRRNGYERLAWAGIIIALFAIGFALWGPVGTFDARDRKKAAQQAKRPGESPKKKTSGLPEIKAGVREIPKKDGAVPGDRSTGKNALVAIVIDDLGQDLKPAREILSLPARITFSVMPGLPQSGAVARLAKRNNREVLLHLPMEHRNQNGKKTPPGMLRADMTPMDFLKTLTGDILSVPSAAGVNNHEGSLLTENKEAMKFLMAELKSRDLFFLDSLTTSKSAAFDTAREFGLRAAKRDVFLDNDGGNGTSIRNQLEELANVAKKHGRAIGIGHPYQATINELRKWLPTVSEQGIEIVPVSRLAR